MKLHNLKIKDAFFKNKRSGLKPWEYRLNDRNFEVNDLIHYVKVDNSDYARYKNNLYKITYVCTHVDYDQIPEGYCIFTEEKIK